MAVLIRGVAMLMLTLPCGMLRSAEIAPPSDPSRPVTVQTTTTQSWIPGRWTKVDTQEIWQPGHWETVQTSTTVPGSNQPSNQYAASATPPATSSWVAERWQQTPDGWVRYAGHWSDQPDVVIERRANEAPRTVYVDRPVESRVVETVVVERPVVRTSSYIGLGWYPGCGWNVNPGWNVSVGFGSPYWYGGYGYRGYTNHHYRPYCPPVSGPVIGVSGGYVRHR